MYFSKVLFIGSLLGVSPELEWGDKAVARIPNSQKDKLRLGELKPPPQGHPAKQKQIGDQNPSLPSGQGSRCRTGVVVGVTSRGGSVPGQRAGQFEARWRELGKAEESYQMPSWGASPKLESW